MKAKAINRMIFEIRGQVRGLGGILERGDEMEIMQIAAGVVVGLMVFHFLRVLFWKIIS